MGMIRLFIREKGSPAAEWWFNYITTINPQPTLENSEIAIKEDLAKQGIEFKDSGSWQLDAWLEFKTEEQKNWFLLRWS